MDKTRIVNFIKHPQTLIIFGTVGFLSITLPLLRSNMYHEKMFPQVFAGEINMSEKTLEEGYQVLKDYASDWKMKEMTLVIGNSTYTTTLNELGIEIDIEETLKKTYRAKRGSNPYTSLRYTFETSIEDIVLKTDTEKVQSYIEANIQPNLNTPVSAAFDIEAGRVVLVDDINGEDISIESLVNPISQVINQNSDPSDIPVQVSSIEPPVTKEELTPLQSQVETLLSVDFKLSMEDTSWESAPEETLSWMTFEEKGNSAQIGIDQERVSEYLKFLNEDIERPAKNAKLRYDRENQKVAIRVPGQTGLTLDIEESVQRIQDAIITGETNVLLAGTVTEPEIYEGNLDTLGISTRIGIGTSNFVGSSTSRVHNIRVAAEDMNGILLAPGEEFSFVEKLGPVNAATGYKPELVIKGDETIPEYGGGVCQVSTTIFRAALYTGLEITERHAHSYVVPFYGTPGLDATIYIPKPDFRFRNNTDNHILLQYYISGTEIGFEIFGAENTRDVNVSGPITLSAGADGSRRTVVYRDVYENGELLTKDSFFSNYRAPNVVNTNPFN